MKSNPVSLLDDAPDEDVIHLQDVKTLLKARMNVTDLRTLMAHYWRKQSTRSIKWGAKDFMDWSKPELIEAVAEAMIDNGDA